MSEEEAIEGGRLERIYLDTCVWCRLFDELDHERIMEEFRAIVRILDKARMGRLVIVKSEVLFYEISRMTGDERDTVERLIDEISDEMIRTTVKTKEVMEDLVSECGLNPVDALHIALAIEHDVDLFLTTDSEILNKRDCIEHYGVDVKNPVEYGAGIDGC
ncbi:MAG: type II toxin-antitoxin system VapC family toxin [Methanobacteriota archaeon]|nr:MAG: type II toxin-antitoxin system VapC family toxin [Euryarchaeota archaeon]